MTQHKAHNQCCATCTNRRRTNNIQPHIWQISVLYLRGVVEIGLNNANVVLIVEIGVFPSIKSNILDIRHPFLII